MRAVSVVIHRIVRRNPRHEIRAKNPRERQVFRVANNVVRQVFVKVVDACVHHCHIDVRGRRRNVPRFRSLNALHSPQRPHARIVWRSARGQYRVLLRRDARIHRVHHAQQLRNSFESDLLGCDGDDAASLLKFHDRIRDGNPLWSKCSAERLRTHPLRQCKQRLVGHVLAHKRKHRFADLVRTPMLLDMSRVAIVRRLYEPFAQLALFAALSVRRKNAPAPCDDFPSCRICRRRRARLRRRAAPAGLCRRARERSGLPGQGYLTLHRMLPPHGCQLRLALGLGSSAPNGNADDHRQGERRKNRYLRTSRHFSTSLKLVWLSFQPSIFPPHRSRSRKNRLSSM